MGRNLGSVFQLNLHIDINPVKANTFSSIIKLLAIKRKRDSGVQMQVVAVGTL